LTAQWSLPPGVEAAVLEAATGPQTSSDGYFFFENVQEFEVLEDTQTSYVGNYQLEPGTYYVHVAGFDESCLPCPVREFSAMATVTIPSSQPAPVVPPPPAAPLPSPPALQPERSATKAPTLTRSRAKSYIRTALRERFGAAYLHGSGKRVAGCLRRSRLRIRCNVSWFAGDTVWRGRVTTRHAYLGGGEWEWDASGKIRRLNEYCRYVRKATNCTKVIRL
jgi:hypothetical protein